MIKPKISSRCLWSQAQTPSFVPRSSDVCKELYLLSYDFDRLTIFSKSQGSCHPFLADLVRGRCLSDVWPWRVTTLTLRWHCFPKTVDNRDPRSLCFDHLECLEGSGYNCFPSFYIANVWDQREKGKRKKWNYKHSRQLTHSTGSLHDLESDHLSTTFRALSDKV